MSVTARKTPCASCPYRCNVPSGVWHAEEYDKLPGYDGDASEQESINIFMCHQGEADTACAGWVGHREHPTDLLAIRLGLATGRLDPSIVDYSTDVDLFPSGAAAAAHGKRDIDDPDDDAIATIDKITRKRDL